jgi:general nucleoside transport system permease protein
MSESAPRERKPTFLDYFVQGLWRSNTPTVTLLAVLLAMIIGGLLIIVSDGAIRESFGYFFAQPTGALSASWTAVSDAYVNLFKGSIVDPETITNLANGTGTWQAVFFPISETLTYAAPLIFTGLSVALAFRGGLFNIGAQGQAILGAMFAGTAGFALHLPYGLHLLVAVVGAALGGLVWGFIPGYLKARTGAHEVITTIMLNYVGLLLLNWFVVQKGVQDPNRSDAISKKVDKTAQLPHLLSGNLRLDGGIILAVAAAAGISWLLNRSTFGFELRAVGANPSAARTAGMSVGRTTILVMAIAGALAGLGGSTGVIGTLGGTSALSGTVAGNVGFDGILVALLGRVKPWGVVLASLLFGALRAGGNRMQSYSGISLELVTVLQALIVLFVAAPAMVKAVFALRASRATGVEVSMAKGW